MAFRYRILFYHENQKWVPKIAPLLDLPIFHMFSTDAETVMQNQLESGEVDVILTGLNTRHFLLVEDGSNSMTYKQAVLWEVIESQKRHCQVILLCTQKEIGLASELVQMGKVADYFVVDPMLDTSRLFIAIMKTLEVGMLIDIVQNKVMKNEKISRHLLESIEALQILRDTPDPVPVEAMPEPAFASQGGWMPEASTSFMEAAGITPEVESVEMDFPSFPSFPTFPTAVEDVPVQEETSAFSAESLFPSLKASLNEPAPEEPLWGTTTAATRKEQKLDGNVLTQNWSKMKRSEFEILMLDNDLVSIQLVQNMVAQTGYKILVANTAEEGMFYMNSERFQLLLINQELPDQNGMDFLNKIRYKGPQSDIPAIVMSENANEDHVIKSIKVGANHLIVKPIQPERLMGHILEFLEKP